MSTVKLMPRWTALSQSHAISMGHPALARVLQNVTLSLTQQPRSGLCPRAMNRQLRRTYSDLRYIYNNELTPSDREILESRIGKPLRDFIPETGPHRWMKEWEVDAANWALGLVAVDQLKNMEALRRQLRGSTPILNQKFLFRPHVEIFFIPPSREAGTPPGELFWTGDDYSVIFSSESKVRVHISLSKALRDAFESGARDRLGYTPDMPTLTMVPYELSLMRHYGESPVDGEIRRCAERDKKRQKMADPRPVISPLTEQSHLEISPLLFYSPNGAPLASTEQLQALTQQGGHWQAVAVRPAHVPQDIQELFHGVEAMTYRGQSMSYRDLFHKVADGIVLTPLLMMYENMKKNDYSIAYLSPWHTPRDIAPPLGNYVMVVGTMTPSDGIVTGDRLYPRDRLTLSHYMANILGSILVERVIDRNCFGNPLEHQIHMIRTANIFQRNFLHGVRDYLLSNATPCRHKRIRESIDSDLLFYNPEAIIRDINGVLGLPSDDLSIAPWIIEAAFMYFGPATGA